MKNKTLFNEIIDKFPERKLVRSLNNQANELAKQHGYQVAKYKGIWNGYNVYIASFNDGHKHYVGLPLYILEKGDEWDSIQSYESLKILKFFQSYKIVGE